MFGARRRPSPPAGAPRARDRLAEAEATVRLLYAQLVWVHEAYDCVSIGLDRALDRLIELDDHEGVTFVDAVMSERGLRSLMHGQRASL